MNTTVDIWLNVVLAVVMLIAAACVVGRVLELRGLGYKLQRTPVGLDFEYRLGIYAGRISLIRDDTVSSPQLTQGVLGWECRFPVYFTVKEMCDFIRLSSLKGIKKGSHSKDLLIFNEIVNLKNDALISLNGNVYTYDNSNHKPFL